MCWLPRLVQKARRRFINGHARRGRHARKRFLVAADKRKRTLRRLMVLGARVACATAVLTTRRGPGRCSWVVSIARVQRPQPGVRSCFGEAGIPAPTACRLHAQHRQARELNRKLGLRTFNLREWAHFNFLLVGDLRMSSARFMLCVNSMCGRPCVLQSPALLVAATSVWSSLREKVPTHADFLCVRVAHFFYTRPAMCRLLQPPCHNF